MVCQLFDILFDDVKTITFVSPTEMKNAVIRWKKHYILLRDLVVSINEIFGKILLVFITVIFAQLITHIYLFVPAFIPNSKYNGSNSTKSNIYHGYIVVKMVSYLIGITMASEKLSQRVSITFFF